MSEVDTRAPDIGQTPEKDENINVKINKRKLIRAGVWVAGLGIAAAGFQAWRVLSDERFPTDNCSGLEQIQINVPDSLTVRLARDIRGDLPPDSLSGIAEQQTAARGYTITTDQLEKLNPTLKHGFSNGSTCVKLGKIAVINNPAAAASGMNLVMGPRPTDLKPIMGGKSEAQLEKQAEVIASANIQQLMTTGSLPAVGEYPLDTSRITNYITNLPNIQTSQITATVTELNALTAPATALGK